MKERDIAKSYAAALVLLGKEKNVDVADEFTKLTEIINQSNALENLLFLNVFTEEEKLSVLKEVTVRLNLSGVVKNFLSFIVQEGRISLMPLIFKEIIVIDDHNKGFIRGTIEGSSSQLDPQFNSKMISFLKDKLKSEPKLTYVKNANISAGYRVTVEDLQLDASLENQLDKFKQSILNS